MYDQLIGFDIRLRAKDYVDVIWDDNRRKRFLLRPEIKWPLSVDDLVWPSVFSDYAPLIEQAPQYKMFGSGIIVEPTNFFHKLFHLWPNLSDMKRRFYQDQTKRFRNGIVIAIALHTEEPPDDEGKWEVLHQFNMSMDDIPQDYVFLGFDVARENLNSGLSNLLFPDTEKRRLREKWSGRLNGYGLFMAVQDALVFTNSAYHADRQHGLYHVFGIFRGPSF